MKIKYVGKRVTQNDPKWNSNNTIISDYDTKRKVYFNYDKTISIKTIQLLNIL